MDELHSRVSQWYEDNGLEIEAFHHAAAANDIERAETSLKERDSLHFRGAVTAILDWLEWLPTTVLNARPLLWEGMPRCCWLLAKRPAWKRNYKLLKLPCKA